MSTGNDEVQLYQDLKGFLGSDRPDLRLSATEAILHIREREGLEQILQCGIITALAKNVGHPQRRIAVNALQALVFLTSHGTTAQHCIQDLLDTTTASGLPRMLEVVLSAPPTTRSTTAELTLWRKQVNFAMALLVNLTRTEEGAVQLAGQTLPDEAIPSQSRTGQTDSPVEILMPARPILDLLLARFLNEQFVDPNFIRQLDTNEKERGAGVDVDQDDRMNAQEGDPYQHFAAVLMNATQVEAGRRFVMRIHYPQGSTATPQSATPQSPPKQPTSVLQKLLPMLKSRNPLRRRGIAGVIKNCCLDKDSAWWLIHQVKITTHLLYPLAGTKDVFVCRTGSTAVVPGDVTHLTFCFCFSDVSYDPLV